MSDPVIEAAQENRLKHGWIDDECVIPGKRGFLYLDGEAWGWALMTDGAEARWTAIVKNKAIADPALTLLVEGDEEAIFAFDAVDLPRVAGLAQCRRKRKLSPEHRAKLVEAGKKFRKVRV